jgi:hypothetical protein
MRRVIITETRDYCFSADDGGILGAQADGNRLRRLCPSTKTLYICYKYQLFVDVVLRTTPKPPLSVLVCIVAKMQMKDTFLWKDVFYPFLKFSGVFHIRCNSGDTVTSNTVITHLTVSTDQVLALYRGFSNCGTQATVQWYTGLVREYWRIKDWKKIPSINAVT